MTLLNSFCTDKIQMGIRIQVRILWENYRPTLLKSVDANILNKMPTAGTRADKS